MTEKKKRRTRILNAPDMTGFALYQDPDLFDERVSVHLVTPEGHRLYFKDKSSAYAFVNEYRAAEGRRKK